MNPFLLETWLDLLIIRMRKRVRGDITGTGISSSMKEGKRETQEVEREVFFRGFSLLNRCLNQLLGTKNDAQIDYRADITWPAGIFQDLKDQA